MDDVRPQTVLFSGPGPVGLAFSKVLDALSEAGLSDEMTFQVQSMSGEGTPVRRPSGENPPLGLILAWDNADFFEHLAILDYHGATGVVAVCPAGLDVSPPWKQPADPRQHAAFESCCELCGLDVGEIMNSLNRLKKKTKNWQKMPARCARSTCARNLAPLVHRFGHGGKYDVTNAFLAPARMLVRALEDDKGGKGVFETPSDGWWTQAGRVWDEFKGITRELDCGLAKYGDLGMELCAAVKD